MTAVKRHSGDFDIGCHNLCVTNHDDNTVTVTDITTEESQSLYEEVPLTNVPAKADQVKMNTMGPVDMLPSFMEESVHLDLVTSPPLPQFISFKDSASISQDADTKYLENDYQITALEEVNPILHLNEADLNEFNLYFGSQSF